MAKFKIKENGEITVLKHLAKMEKEVKMKAKCPKCGKIITFPFKDRVNVFLFGGLKKYHTCKG